MERFDACTFKARYPDGLELSFETVCRLTTDLINPSQRDSICNMLDLLKGSKVKAFLLPYSKIKSDVRVQLRCGEHCSVSLSPDCISEVINLAPFIAACAGPAEEEVEPSRLERLEQRVDNLERAAFPELYDK